jgi:hypothetical protein
LLPKRKAYGTGGMLVGDVPENSPFSHLSTADGPACPCERRIPTMSVAANHDDGMLIFLNLSIGLVVDVACGHEHSKLAMS